MFCQHCGANVEPNTVFCPACGQQQALASGNAAPPPIPAGVPMAAPPPFIPPMMVKAKTGEWIGQSWELVKTDIGLFAGMTLIYAIVGGAVPLILQGSMQSGFFIACMRKLVRGRMEIADLFLGFNYFVQSLLAVIVISIFGFVGVLFCIIPGLVIYAMYSFTYLFMVDKRLEFWPAMQASHAVVKNDYVGFSLFLLTLGLLNVGGLLCCLIGLLVTIPITFMAITIAYREIVGIEPTTV